MVSCTANQHELVGDLLTKAKQLEYLIAALPKPPPPRTRPRAQKAEAENDLSTADEEKQDGGDEDDEDDEELAELERELQQSNREYLDALQVAGRSMPSALWTTCLRIVWGSHSHAMRLVVPFMQSRCMPSSPSAFAMPWMPKLSLHRSTDAGAFGLTAIHVVYTSHALI